MRRTGRGENLRQKMDGRRGEGDARKVLQKGCEVTKHGAGASSHGGQVRQA